MKDAPFWIFYAIVYVILWMLWIATWNDPMMYNIDYAP